MSYAILLKLETNHGRPQLAFNALKWSLIGVFLNTSDALLTNYVLVRGATEANPFMAALIAVSMTFFLVFKLFTVNAFIVLLAVTAKHYKYAQWAFQAIVLLYSVVFLNHIVNLFLLN